jgi:hypothetical protein
MSLIFLSHAHEDKIFVTEVNRQLKTNGISSWYDSDSIGNGDRLHREIVQGISDARVYCLFYSKAAATSGNVKFEIDHAIKKSVSDPSFQICVFVLDEAKIPNELAIWAYTRLSVVENRISFVLESLKSRIPSSYLTCPPVIYSLGAEALDVAYEIIGGRVFGSHFIDQDSNLLLVLKGSAKDACAYEACVYKRLGGSRFILKHTYTGQGRVQKFGIDQVEGRSILTINSWDGGNGMGEHFFLLVDLNTLEQFSYHEGRLYAYYEGPISPVVRINDGLFISEQSFFELTLKYEFFEKEEIDRKNWFYANRIWLARNNDKSNLGRIDLIPFESELDENDLKMKVDGVGCQWLMRERGPIIYKHIQSGKNYIAMATASRYNEFDNLKLTKNGISFSVDKQKFELAYENDGWRLLEK